MFISGKCAFFVYDESEGGFLPYAAAGYDKSTGNKMFFPEEKMKSLFGWNCESPLLTQKNDRQNPYFSRKEFDLLDRILLVPFNYDSEFLGFLMITQCDFFEDPNLLVSVGKLMEPISELLFKKRFESLDQMTGEIYGATPDILPLISELAKGSVEKKKKLLYLSFKVWMDAIYSDTHILPYCFKGDLRAIIGAMVAEDGKLIDLPGPGVLLLFPSSRMDDPDLLIHQISISCQRVFPSVYDDISPSLKILEFESSEKGALSLFLGSIEDGD